MYLKEHLKVFISFSDMENNIGQELNPWTKNLDQYHVWCCPECGFKGQTKQLLVHHGLITHPMAREVFQKSLPKPNQQQPAAETKPEPKFEVDNSKIEKRFIDFGFKERK